MEDGTVISNDNKNLEGILNRDIARPLIEGHELNKISAEVNAALLKEYQNTHSNAKNLPSYLMSKISPLHYYQKYNNNQKKLDIAWKTKNTIDLFINGLKSKKVQADKIVQRPITTGPNKDTGTCTTTSDTNCSLTKAQNAMAASTPTKPIDNAYIPVGFSLPATS